MTQPLGGTFREHAYKVSLSWIWFFLILLSYYCLKPLRDGLASSLSKSLGNLYLATFFSTIVVLSVYSQLVAVARRKLLVFCVYQFFSLCLLGFWFLFHSPWHDSLVLVAVFFVWVSVFNLFVVTLFWSVMADTFSVEQGKTWFGVIAAAGSVGSICGSAVAYKLSQWFGPTGLIATAIGALELSVVVAFTLMTGQDRVTANINELNRGGGATLVDEQGTGGTLYAGLTRVASSPYLLGICLFVALGKFAATFIYNNLQVVMEHSVPDRQARTTMFSQMNLFAQTGSLFAQAVVSGWLMKQFGVGAALCLPCGLMFALFVWLSYDTALMTLIVGQVMQQIFGYGLLVPAQHVLFTVVPREDKYKSKAFTDTVVFRGSDVAAGKACDWMIRTGTALNQLSLVMLPVVLVWGATGTWLGRAYRKRVPAEISSSPSSTVVDGTK